MATNDMPGKMDDNEMEPSEMEPSEMDPSKVDPGKAARGTMDPGKVETTKMDTIAASTPSTPQDHPVGRTQDAVTAPARPKGPNVSPIILGLVALLFAGLVIAQETMRLRVDWSRMGPGMIVGIGVVMVVIGAIGLARRHDNV